MRLCIYVSRIYLFYVSFVFLHQRRLTSFTYWGSVDNVEILDSVPVSILCREKKKEITMVERISNRTTCTYIQNLADRTMLNKIHVVDCCS